MVEVLASAQQLTSAQQLRLVHQQLKACAASFDVDVVTGGDAVGLLRVASEVEAMASSVKLLLARRVERTNQHQGGGFCSAGDLVASQTGMSGSQARMALATARHLESLPKTAEAFSSGRLSAGQVETVVRGAAADPTAECELLGFAERDSLEALNRKSRSLEKLASLGQRRRQQRLAFQQGACGMTQFWGSLANEDFAFVKSALDARVRKFFVAARKAGEHRSQASYLADALVDLARDGFSSGTGSRPGSRSRATINVVVDYPVIAGAGGGCCEVPGVGPISAETAREWANDCYLNVLLRKGKDVTTVGSERRYVPADVRRALNVHHPVCGVRGCEQTVGLELDHREELQYGGRSSFDNLGYLCRHHHKLKTHDGFRLDGEPGDYVLVPHDDKSPPGDRGAEGKSGRKGVD